MNPIDKAHREVAADVFEDAMSALAKEGIGAEEAFISSDEFTNILEEVDHRVTQGKENPTEISTWVQARLRVLINRPTISEEQARIFEDLDTVDFDDALAA